MCRKKTDSGSGSSMGKHIEDFGFSIRDNKLWYRDNQVEGFDPNTFSVVDDCYAKDAKQVLFYQTYRDSRSYFLSKKSELYQLPEADPASFVALGEGYGKDKNKAYFTGESFPVRDLNSLVVLNRQFIKDDQVAYLEREEIKGSQGKTFELIGSVYAKDAGQVYYYQLASSGTPEIKPISQSPHSFSLIEHPYAKDDKNIFYFGEKHPTRSPETFEILGSGYTKDKAQVYFQTNIIKDADAKSFQIFKENQDFTGEGAYANDAHNIYYKNQIVLSVDRNSFVILNENYSKDRNHVYFHDKVLKEGDVSSYFPMTWETLMPEIKAIITIWVKRLLMSERIAVITIWRAVCTSCIFNSTAIV
jgi:hypothetical protein